MTGAGREDADAQEQEAPVDKSRDCASFSSSYAMKGLVKAFAEMDNFAGRVFKPLLNRPGLRKVPFTTCAILLVAC